MSAPAPPPRAGLCATCVWAAVRTSRRSSFLHCRRSEREPQYPRYPSLPVLACAGHEPGEPEAPDFVLRAR